MRDGQGSDCAWELLWGEEKKTVQRPQLRESLNWKASRLYSQEKHQKVGDSRIKIKPAEPATDTSSKGKVWEFEVQRTVAWYT